MKAHVCRSRVETYKFIHLVEAENNFLCRYFCRLGPALEYIKHGRLQLKQRMFGQLLSANIDQNRPLVAQVQNPDFAHFWLIDNPNEK